ncbi:SBBP repeat-containing protein [Paludisphaera borealis]|uniref:Beta-propeller repeat protein n=1 Tax=Paludisphaera borealis TaxID=1387353 RepID=A0A1U7CZG2_9BACT|nr:SBBP repeat-containing protein [Paludisphaera borealis]APW64286.1 hypothetical protein BSF38_10073 [Paludisphaera borealis]
MMSIRTQRRRALRPRLESLEGRVVLSAVFDSVLGVGSDTGHGPLPNRIAVDSAGNTYITGVFARETDFDPTVNRPNGTDVLTPRGATDAFVAKYAPDNSLVWARRMGGDDAASTADTGADLAVDSAGNVFVTGAFIGRADFGSFTLTSAGDSDAFVAKLDANGSVLWAKCWGGTTRDGGNGIAVDAAGNVVSVGNTIAVNSAGGQNYTGFEVRKFGPTGAAVWSKRIDNSGGTAVSVATDAAGNVFVGGQFYGTTDFDPDPKKTNNVAGASKMAVNGGANSYVLKLTNSGAFGWVAPFVAKTAEASNSWAFIEDLAVDGGGSVVVGGHVSGQVDLNPSSSIDYRLPTPNQFNGFVAKLSAGGSLAWAKLTGGKYVHSVAMDTSGAVYATGQFSAEGFTRGSGLPDVASNGGLDVYVTKFTAAGSVDWALTFGGAGTDVAFGIAVDASGTIYLVGRNQYTVDFDPDPSTTHDLDGSGYLGMFVLKLRQS